MDGDGGFACEAERVGERDGHHVAGVAHIVGGDPFPEAELLLGDHGFGVEDGEDVFDLVGGDLVVDAANQGGVEFFAAELNHDALSDADVVVVFVGDAVGVGSWDVERQQDLSEQGGHSGGSLCCFGRE